MQRDVISLQRLSPKTKETTKRKEIKIKIKKAIGRFLLLFCQMILFCSNDKNEKTFGREETTSDLGPPDQNVFCKKCNMYKNVQKCNK